MIKKFTGYFISVIGILIVSIGAIPGMRDSLNFVPDGISNLTIMIIGILIAALGIVFVYLDSKSSTQNAEVPIYHGKNVVGFRRLGK